MTYQERRKLVKEYQKWAYQHKALDCFENFTLFLCEKDLLDLDMTYRFLEVQNDL